MFWKNMLMLMIILQNYVQAIGIDHAVAFRLKDDW